MHWEHWKVRRKMGRDGLIGSRKLRTEEGRFIAAAENSRVVGLLLLALLWLICATMLIVPTRQSVAIPLVLKQEAPRTVFSDIDFSYEDKDNTQDKKRQVLETVPLYFQISQEDTLECTKNIEECFRAVISRAEAEKNHKPFVPLVSWQSQLVANLDEATQKVFYALAQDEPQWKKFLYDIDLTLGQGLFSNNAKNNYKVGQLIRLVDARGRDRYPKQAVEIMTVDEAADGIAESMLKYYSSSDNRNELRKNIAQAISKIIGVNGNLRYDQTKTEFTRKQALAQTSPVMIEIKKHQPLITRKQIITMRELELIQAYEKASMEQSSESISIQSVFRDLTWSLLLMVFVGLYMFHIHPEMVRSNQNLTLCGTVVIVSLLINYFSVDLFFFFSSNFAIFPGMMNNAIPLALSAVLLAVMLGLRVAIYVGFFTSAMTAMFMGNSFNIAIEGLVVCCVCAVAVRSSTNYREFFLRCVIAVFLTFWILDFNQLWRIKTEPALFFWSGGLALINGLVTGMLALTLTFVFELLFNVTTNMSLLVFSDYNHPLLKRLQLEAPGTFYHSLQVSTLAEYAAKEIKANPIRARVCALFHDIGKLSKPEYFSENNIEAEKKHQELHPRMSSLIILNHVKEGIDLALKYKLRKIIRDTIQQHHGTDLVFYFYRRALENVKDSGEPVEEHAYRYLGPLPREKEVVLVSLADACEAACRSLSKPTANKIENTVLEIFRRRQRDGQLDAANLTCAELSKIRDSFIKTLTTMYHSRVAYPKDEVADEDNLQLENKIIAET
jgi:putative nucleotidyltransferase with HDIG domain